MKIAVSTAGCDLESAMDGRFGRAAGFIIYNDDTGGHDHVDNAQNMDSSQGAGIQAAKTVVNAGAEVLITGNVGPKAHAALTASGVAVYLKSGGSVKEAIEAFRSGSLERSAEANVEGHW